MADHGIDTAETRKRAAERAARIVLAKHPCVVPGSVPPKERAAEAPTFARTIDIGARNVGRALSHGSPSRSTRS